MLKTLLAIPPKYGIDYPPLGTPALLGYLKSRGIAAQQVDWNRQYQHLGFGCAKDINRKGHYGHLLPVQEAKDTPYQDNTYSSFWFTERILSSELLLSFIRDEKENPFHRFILQCRLVEEIKSHDAQVLGISIISPSQVLFSFTLGYLLKKSGSKTHRVIGGQWVSLYRNQISCRDDFSEFFDYAIFFEGESAFLKLISALAENSVDLGSVPNLIYKEGQRFVFSAPRSVENMDELPAPDFEGLPLVSYNSSSSERISLTFETSRECYWNKCAYCVDLPHPKQGYRHKSPRLVVRDMQALWDRYPLGDLMISDPAMSPRQMRGISDEITRQKLKVSWWCFCRADKGFNKEVFCAAKNAGCHSVSFGLETANQRLLDFLSKGINLEVAKRVFRDCYESGLNVQLQMMIGLPGETAQDALETIHFLVENRNIIQQVTFNVYYLTPGCLIAKNMEKYGIIAEENHLPFQFFREFTYSREGLTKKESYSLIRLYNILMEKYVQQ